MLVAAAVITLGIAESDERERPGAGGGARGPNSASTSGAQRARTRATGVTSISPRRTVSRRASSTFPGSAALWAIIDWPMPDGTMYKARPNCQTML